MKKAMIIITMISLLLTGCSSRPPVPELTAGKIDIPVEMGSYSWRVLTKSVIADAPGPTDLMKDTTPVSIKPNAEVLIKFSNKPNKLIWSRWMKREVIDQVELKSNKKTLPMEKGEYIYSLRAEWGEHKSGVYAFKVRVE